MDTTNQKIVSYVAEASSYYTELKTMEQANAEMASKLGVEFGKASKLISSNIGKITKVKVFDEEGNYQIKRMEELSSVIETTKGKYVEFNQVRTDFAGQTKTESASLKDVTDKYTKLLKVQSPLIGQASQLGTNFSNITDINQKFAKGLAEVGGASRIVSKGMDTITDSGRKLSAIVEGTNGKFYQLNETSKMTPEGVQKVSRSVKEVSKEMANGSTATATMTQNIARLASRAILTIPLWLALRGAIMGTISVVKEGVKAIIDQDKAFQKARRNIEATAGSQEQLNAQFKTLKDETLKLSLASGKSVVELTDAFQRFATVGFNAGTSLVGMQYATKLAVAEFGDAKETADAFARTMRVLIDTTAGAKPEAQQLAEAMALTDDLWKTNAFEIKEFTNNLSKFAGTAKIANLSAKETLTLLATLSTGALNNTAGALIKTTVFKTLGNLQEIASSLNIAVNPALDSTYSVLIKVVDALSKLGEGQKVPEKLGKELKELYSIKGGQAIATLVSLKDTLQANINLKGEVSGLDKAFDDVTKTTGVLVDRFHTANSAIGKTLMEGVLGGEAFKSTLEIVVKSLEGMIPVAETTGYSINSIGVGFQRLYDITQLIYKSDPFLRMGVSIFGTMGKAISLFAELDKVEKELLALETASLSFGEQINKALDGAISVDAIERIISEIEARLKSPELSVGFDIGVLEKSLSMLRLIVSSKKETLKVTQAQEQAENKLTDASNGYLDSSFAELDIKKKIVEYTKEQLKLQGLNASEILKTEQQLINQYGLEDKIEDKLDRQLKIQQELRKEKALTNNVSSTAVKLFDIAKTEGTDIAKKISEVLSGDVDFDIFTRQGGKALEVFKSNFEDIFKAQQVKSFFKGDVVPGEKGLRGGAGITLPEEDKYLQNSKTYIVSMAKSEVSLAQARLRIEERINALRTQDLAKQEEAKKKTGYQNLPVNKELPDLSKTIEVEYNKFLKGQISAPSQVKAIEAPPTKQKTDMDSLTNEYDRLMFSPDRQKFLKSPANSPIDRINTNDISIAVNAIANIDGKNMEEMQKAIDASFDKAKAQTMKEVKDKLLGKQGGEL